jgi:hypothetical protein
MDGAAARTRKGNGMGYKPKRTLYKLTFDDPDLDGLEVETRSVSIDGLLSFFDLLEKAQAMDEEAPDLTVFADVAERFAKVLVRWNVEEDDGTPVPATAGGLLSQDIGFMVQILDAWTAAMSKAPPPLPGASKPSVPPPEESLGLASQSAPLPSLPVPA